MARGQARNGGRRGGAPVFGGRRHGSAARASPAWETLRGPLAYAALAVLAFALASSAFWEALFSATRGAAVVVDSTTSAAARHARLQGFVFCSDRQGGAHDERKNWTIRWQRCRFSIYDQTHQRKRAAVAREKTAVDVDTTNTLQTSSGSAASVDTALANSSACLLPSIQTQDL